MILVLVGELFLKLCRMTCRMLMFGFEFAGRLLAWRLLERTIEGALEIDLRRWFEQPDAGSFEAFREAREALLFLQATLTLPFSL